jgi:hypothetical protein
MLKLRSLDDSDKAYFAGAIIAPIVVWWFFTGRKKYGVRGMK